MSATEPKGVYQLPNGMWGYRYAYMLNGKQRDLKRTKDENGNPFKTEGAALKAREAAIIKEHLEQSQKPKRKRAMFSFERFCPAFRPKLTGRSSLVLSKDPAKIKFIVIPNVKGDLLYRKLGALQQLLCSKYTQPSNLRPRCNTVPLPKTVDQMNGTVPGSPRQFRDRDPLGIVLSDIRVCFINSILSHILPWLKQIPNVTAKMLLRPPLGKL